MHPRISEVLGHLDDTRSALERAVAAVPESARATRPAPESWSVAEIVEHVSLVEARIATALVEKIENAIANGLATESETTPVIAEAFVNDFLDRSERRTASDASQPHGASLEASWSVLHAQRRRLRDAVMAADGLALGSLRMPHPRVGDIDLYQWLTFLGAHEARHVVQVHEAGAALRA